MPWHVQVTDVNKKDLATALREEAERLSEATQPDPAFVDPGPGPDEDPEAYQPVEPPDVLVQPDLAPALEDGSVEVTINAAEALAGPITEELVAASISGHGGAADPDPAQYDYVGANVNGRVAQQ